MIKMNQKGASYKLIQKISKILKNQHEKLVLTFLEQYRLKQLWSKYHEQVRQKNLKQRNVIQAQNYKNYSRITKQIKEKLQKIFSNTPNMSLQQMAKISGLKEVMIGQLQQEFMLTGNIQLNQANSIRQLELVRRQQQENNIIISLVKKNPRVRQQQITQCLRRKGFFMSKSELYRRLTKDLDYSFRPIPTKQQPELPKNTEDVISKRAQFIKIIKQHSIEDFILIGSISFKVKPPMGCCWAPNIEKKKLQKDKQNEQISLVISINTDKIISYEIIQRTLTQGDLIEHLNKYLIQSYLSKNNTVVMVQFDEYSRNKNIKMTNSVYNSQFDEQESIQPEVIEVQSEEINFEKQLKGFTEQQPQLFVKIVQNNNDSSVIEISQIDQNLSDSSLNSRSILNDLEDSDNEQYQYRPKPALLSYLQLQKINWVMVPPFTPKLGPMSRLMHEINEKYKAIRLLNKICGHQDIVSALKQVMKLTLMNQQLPPLFYELKRYMNITEVTIENLIENPQNLSWLK